MKSKLLRALAALASACPFVVLAASEAQESVLASDAAFGLIDELYAHATQPKYEYRHKWLPGDMVIWDNRTTMHRARRYNDLHDIRDMRRSTIRGDSMTTEQVSEAA